MHAVGSDLRRCRMNFLSLLITLSFFRSLIIHSVLQAGPSDRLLVRSNLTPVNCEPFYRFKICSLSLSLSLFLSLSLSLSLCVCVCVCLSVFYSPANIVSGGDFRVEIFRVEIPIEMMSHHSSFLTRS